MDLNEPIEVPVDDLDPETLRAVIESFILREGTDYGAQEAAFQTKIDQVFRQLVSHEVTLMFDPVEDTCTLIPKSKPS